MSQDVGDDKEVGNFNIISSLNERCVFFLVLLNQHIAKLRVSLSQKNNSTVAVYTDVFQGNLMVFLITQVI
jgi:hypothetical protein